MNINYPKGFLRLTLIVSVVVGIAFFQYEVKSDFGNRWEVILNFRVKYPEYNDLSNDELLKRIIKKFYLAERITPTLTDTDIAQFDKLKTLGITKDHILLHPSRWILGFLLSFSFVWLFYAFVRWVIIGFIMKGFRM